jgi:hypothetical protein
VSTPLRLALLVALLAARPGAALAWHESGHRIVARIAWDGLTPAQQAFAATLLEQHPRFAEDFAGEMPAELRARPATDPARRRWVFAHAAIWPDRIKETVRRLGERLAAADAADRAALERRLAEARAYDHPTWHYDNQPVLVDPYALPPAPAPAERPMGIQRALPAALRELGDRDLPAPRRAVALAWVIHLVGDAHQPLHAATLFAAGPLPQGDAGGNRVPVTLPAARATPTNLHAAWDGLLGHDAAAEPAEQRRVVAAHPRRSLAAALAASAAASAEARVNLWLDESYRAADAHVYTPALREALRTAGAAPVTVALDRRYLRAAKAAATRRVATAGYRLGDCIAEAAD